MMATVVSAGVNGWFAKLYTEIDDDKLTCSEDATIHPKFGIFDYDE